MCGVFDACLLGMFFVDLFGFSSLIAHNRQALEGKGSGIPPNHPDHKFNEFGVRN